MDDRQGHGRRTADGSLRDDLDELQALVVSQNDIIVQQSRVIADNKRRLRDAAIGYVFLLVLVAAALLILENRDKGHLRESQIAACRQANVVLDLENRNAEVLFAATFATRIREAKLAKSGPNGRTHQLSVAATKKYGDHVRHAAATDCDEAVRDPSGYQFPSPQRFTNRDIPFDLLPPR